LNVLTFLLAANLTVKLMQRNRLSDSTVLAVFLRKLKQVIIITMLRRWFDRDFLRARQLRYEQMLFWRRLSVHLFVCPHKISKTIGRKLI